MSFLTPQDRNLLIDSLRPPLGFDLSMAIGTTYSLDLLALMVAPIGFTMFEMDPEREGQGPSVELVETIRRYASKIAIFCEAGRINVPGSYRSLLAYLEESIVEARAPLAKHAFHPKAWFIRYAKESGEIRYRLLCLSRNLTFDRSWDTILILDGELDLDRVNGFTLNNPLSDFVESLPLMAVRDLPEGIREKASIIAEEIRRVEWDTEGLPFAIEGFFPMGHTGKKSWPFKDTRIQRIAIISPFVSEGILSRISPGSTSSVLISRQESLDQITRECLDQYQSLYRLTDKVDVIEEDSEVDNYPGALNIPLQGLHAKIYVADDGWDAHVWTGSANATESAFSGNVEFMVQLGGRKSELGIDALLGKVKGMPSFVDLLEPYQRCETDGIDPEREALKEEIEGFRSDIACLHWSIRATKDQDCEGFRLKVLSDSSLPAWPSHIRISCRPLSIETKKSISLVPGEGAELDFASVSLESLSSFLVLSIDAEKAGFREGYQFIVNAVLQGAPADRKDRLLQHLIKDRKALVRFLLMILADCTEGEGEGYDESSFATLGSDRNEIPDSALLEPLLKTLARNPGRLDAVATLLEGLRKTEEGGGLLPAGLGHIFDAIIEARKSL